MALQTLKQAFTTDVSPILAMARYRAGGAIDPVAAVSAPAATAQRKAQERPARERSTAGLIGIVQTRRSAIRSAERREARLQEGSA